MTATSVDERPRLYFFIRHTSASQNDVPVNRTKEEKRLVENGKKRQKIFRDL